MDIVSAKKTNTIATKKTNTIPTKKTSTASINFHRKSSKRLLYFAYSFIDYGYIIDSS